MENNDETCYGNPDVPDTNAAIDVKPENNTAQNRLELVKLYYDFQYKSLSEAANILAKGLPIYFTVLGVLCAYFLTQKIAIEVVNYITIIAIGISFFVLFAYAVVVHGLIVGLHELEDTLRKADIKFFEQSNLTSFITRGKKAVVIVLIAFIIVVAIICIGFMKYPHFIDG